MGLLFVITNTYRVYLKGYRYRLYLTIKNPYDELTNIFRK